jgi:ATP-binding cassette subfamily C (CFTR/MRP) protein 4
MAPQADQNRDQQGNHNNTIVKENDDGEDKGLLPKDDDNNDNNDDTYKDNNNGNGRAENPYPKASLFSKCFFTWPYPLLKLGMERTLEESDLPNIMKEESSTYNRNLIEDIWEKELKRVEKINNKNRTNNNKKKEVKPNLCRALLIDYFKTTWIIQPFMFCASAARIVMALALGNLTQAFIDRNGTDGYLWAGTIVFCNIIVLMEHHHVFYITSRKGMNLRTGCVAAVFNKSLRLSSIGGGNTGGDGSDTGSGSSSKKDTAVSSGRVMNLVSNDTERFWVASLFISYAIWAPVQSIAIFFLGIHLIGPAFAIGMVFLIFMFIPVQTYLAKGFAKVRSKVRSTRNKECALFLSC